MNTIDAIVNIARGTDIFKVCVCQIDYSNDEHALTDEVGCYMFHRQTYDYRFIGVDEHLKASLVQMESKGFVLNSQVLLKDGRYAHIPLLDFLCEVNDKNTSRVIAGLKLLDLKHGYLMYSGSSYHFIGSDVLCESDYKSLLYHSLLLSTLVDCRWVAHQLINGSSNLRMGEKNGIVPQLIKKIDD